MLAMQLDIKTEHQDSTVILTLEGGLCGLETHKLRKQADRLALHTAQTLILDLTRLTQLDSSGVGVLNHLRVEYKRLGRRLALVEPANASVRHALEISRLNHLIETHPDRAAALRQLKPAPASTESASQSPAIPATAPQTLLPTASFSTTGLTPESDPTALNQRLDNIEHRLERIELMLEIILRQVSRSS